MTRFTGTDVVCFRAERIVFEGLNFALEPGGALMLRGANGSGKSSLLRLMAGLSQPLSGTIAWNDTDITDALGWGAGLAFYDLALHGM